MKSNCTVELIKERKSIESTIGPCSLSYYRDIVRALNGPSNRQIENFIKYVCSAQNWYKDLPIFPPGVQFIFFLDPYSGMEHVLQPGGHVFHRERIVVSPESYLTRMTTKEYRSRFGYLSFVANFRTSFLLQSQYKVSEYADLPIIDIGLSIYRIPPEVARVGSVELTAVIHPHTPVHLQLNGNWTLYEQGHHQHPDLSVNWPIETGGVETLRKIELLLNRCLDLDYSDEFIRQMKVLLLPERERLQKEMVYAIHRMLELVFLGGER